MSVKSLAHFDFTVSDKRFIDEVSSEIWTGSPNTTLPSNGVKKFGGRSVNNLYYYDGIKVSNNDGTFNITTSGQYEIEMFIYPSNYGCILRTDTHGQPDHLYYYDGHTFKGVQGNGIAPESCGALGGELAINTSLPNGEMDANKKAYLTNLISLNGYNFICEYEGIILDPLYYYDGHVFSPYYPSLSTVSCATLVKDYVYSGNFDLATSTSAEKNQFLTSLLKGGSTSGIIGSYSSTWGYSNPESTVPTVGYLQKINPSSGQWTDYGQASTGTKIDHSPSGVLIREWEDEGLESEWLRLRIEPTSRLLDLVCKSSSGFANSKSTVPITLNKWQHILLRINNLTAKVYLDGLEILSTVLPEATIRPKEIKVASYPGYVDEFVFRDNVSAGNIITVPTQAYIGQTAPIDIGVSRHRNFGNIRNLLHFDYPYYGEKSDGLGDEATGKAWMKEGHTKLAGTKYPRELASNPKFGYRCAYFPDSTSKITYPNEDDKLDISLDKSYEFELFVKGDNDIGELKAQVLDAWGYRFWGGHTFALMKINNNGDGYYATHATAKGYCESLGGHLASITSKEKNDFLTSIIPYGHSAAVGGRRFNDAGTDTGVWTWDSGEAFNYKDIGEYANREWQQSIALSKTQNYYPSSAYEESNKRASLKLNYDGIWRLVPASNYFICEWDADIRYTTTADAINLFTVDPHFAACEGRIFEYGQWIDTTRYWGKCGLIGRRRPAADTYHNNVYCNAGYLTSYDLELYCAERYAYPVTVNTSAVLSLLNDIADKWAWVNDYKAYSTGLVKEGDTFYWKSGEAVTDEQLEMLGITAPYESDSDANRKYYVFDASSDTRKMVGYHKDTYLRGVVEWWSEREFWYGQFAGLNAREKNNDNIDDYYSGDDLYEKRLYKEYCCAGTEIKHYYHNGHTFAMIDLGEAVTFEKAREACVARGGHLPFVGSWARNQFLSAIARRIWNNGGSRIWLGYKYGDGWVDTEQSTEYTFVRPDTSTASYEVSEDNPYYVMNIHANNRNEYSGNGNTYWYCVNDTATGYVICEWDYDMRVVRQKGDGILALDELLTLKWGENNQLELKIPSWSIDDTITLRDITPVFRLNDVWTHLLLRIQDRAVKVYQDGVLKLDATITGDTELRPTKISLGGYGYIDEFVYRSTNHIFPNTPTVPLKPYSGTLNIKSLGGFGTGADGDVTLATNAVQQINSYCVIDIVSGHKTVTVASLNDGLYPFIEGCEVMIHVTAPKSTDPSEYPEIGFYGFTKVSAISDETIEFTDEITTENGYDFTLTQDLVNKYYVQVITVPNFASLTLGSTTDSKHGYLAPLAWGNATGGAIVVFRTTDDITLGAGSNQYKGQILVDAAQGLRRYDWHQMTNSQLIDRFLVENGGGIFIACGGEVKILHEESYIGGPSTYPAGYGAATFLSETTAETVFVGYGGTSNFSLGNVKQGLETSTGIPSASTSYSSGGAPGSMNSETNQKRTGTSIVLLANRLSLRFIKENRIRTAATSTGGTGFSYIAVSEWTDDE